MLKIVKDGDSVVIVTSGHGSGDGKGNSYICLYDCKTYDKLNGSYWDYELQADLLSVKKIKTFIFLDNCYSGGMLDNLKSTKFSCNDYLYCKWIWI